MMKLEINIIYLLFLLLIYMNPNVNGQESPCPDVFEYKFDGYSWYGTVKVPSVGRGRTNLAVTLSIEDTLSQDNSGHLELLNDVNTLYTIIDNGGLLQYKNVFPISEFIPTVRSIKLNRREFCNNPAGPTNGPQSTITVVHSFQTNSNQPPTFNLQPQIPSQPQPLPLQPPLQTTQSPLPQPPQNQPNTELHSGSSSSNDVGWLSTMSTRDTCGKKLENGHLRPVHTIINGQKVEPGQYPWLAAIYDQKWAFICGGSLVTNKHAITAAHCITVRWLYVELGRYNREDNQENVILRITKDIVIHPDYKQNTGHADLAIMTFTEEVKFNDKVNPICLWPFGSGGIGMKGAVVGWGTDLSGDTTPEVMQTDVDIVSQETCLKSNQLYSSITSSNTYCAGGRGTGPCKGDSGGGMYMNIRNRWYLRGIISTSIGPNDYSCNVNLYAVYADISTYLNWLRRYLI